MWSLSTATSSDVTGDSLRARTETEAAGSSRTDMLGVGLVRATRALIPGGRFTRSIAVLAGGTAIGQMIVTAASPLLTRLYTPEDFGLLGVYVAMLTVVSVVASLRYELAIPLPRETDIAASLVVLSLSVLPVTALSLALALWCFGDDLLSWAHAPGLAPYLWLLPLSLVCLGVHQVLSYWVIRKRAFATVARVKLKQAGAATLAQLGLSPFGSLGLLLGQTVGNVVAGGALALAVAREDAPAFHGVRRASLFHAAYRFRRFPQVSCLSGLINTSGLQLPVVLFAAFYGSTVAGQFALVQRIVGLPLYLVGQAVAQVYLPESVAAVNTAPALLRPLFLRTTKWLALASAVPLLTLLAAGPTLFSCVFGPDWTTAGEFARYVAPMAALQLVVSPLSHTFNVIGRQTWQLAWDFLRLVMAAGSISLAAHLRCDASKAVAFYAAAMLAAYFLLWFLQLIGLSWPYHRAVSSRAAGDREGTDGC